MSDINDRRNEGTEANLRFPTGDGSVRTSIHDQYFVKFDIYKFERTRIDRKNTNISDLAGKIADRTSNAFNYSTKQPELVSTITLPLQTSIEEKTSANFTEKSSKNISRIATIATQGGAANTMSAAGQMFTSLLAENASKVSEELKDVYLGGIGKAINEQMQVVYEGPERRKYSMEFTLIPRNSRDANTMQKIRKRFHYHASPSRSQFGTFFNYPDMVRFSFFRRKPNEDTIEPIENLFRSKFCYLEEVSVEHGDDKYFEMQDSLGTNRNTGFMKLSLSLYEAQFHLKNDFEDMEGNE